MSNQRKSIISSLAWIVGGMSILGAVINSLAGLFFGVIGAILSIVAIFKYKESKKVLIPWLLGIVLSIAILYIFAHIGPVPKPSMKIN